MSTSVEGFLNLDMNCTPGFFTAAMQDSTDNPFEVAFLGENGRRGTDANDAANLFLQDPSSVAHLRNDFEPSPFPYNSQTGPAMAPTPPTRLSGDAAAWPFNALGSRQGFEALLDTHAHPSSARVQYGQITPPGSKSPSAEEHPRSSEAPAGLEDQAVSAHGPSKGKKGHAPAKRTGEHPKAKPRRSRKSISSMSDANADGEPTGPVDEKRAKFLERNRVAASKCRQKKKQWSSDMEQQYHALQTEQKRLHAVHFSYREELISLKTLLLKHADCGGDAVRAYLAREATSILTSGPQSPLGSAPSPSEPGRSSRNSSVVSSSLADSQAGGPGQLPRIDDEDAGEDGMGFDDEDVKITPSP